MIFKNINGYNFGRKFFSSGTRENPALCVVTSEHVLSRLMSARYLKTHSFLKKILLRNQTNFYNISFFVIC